MNNTDLIELEKKKGKLLVGMTDYMSSNDGDFDAGYAGADIKKCDKILVKFIGNLQKQTPNAAQSEILNCVRKVVLDLNKLNDSVAGCLIETDQREELCDYIEYAARRSGLRTTVHDVTEEWREW